MKLIHQSGGAGRPAPTDHHDTTSLLLEPRRAVSRKGRLAQPPETIEELLHRMEAFLETEDSRPLRARPGRRRSLGRRMAHRVATGRYGGRTARNPRFGFS